MPTHRNAPDHATVSERLVRDAIGFFQRGHLQEAKRHFLSILAIDQHHFLALNLLGVTEAQLGHPDTALRWLELAVEQNPRSPETLNNFGMVLHQLGRDREAVERYRAAVKLTPNYAIAHNNLGVALSALGSRDDAVTSFRKALSIKPDYSEALNNLGTELFAAARYEEAKTLFAGALAAKPDYPDAEFNLANALAACRRYDEAIGHFEKAIAFRPDLAGPHLGLGNALIALRHYWDAIPQLERAEALAPGNADVEMGLGIAFSGLGRHELAVSHFQRALLLKPDFADAEMHLGIVFVASGHHDEAVKHLMRVLAMRPDDAEGEMHLGLAFAAVHDHDQAISHYRRALELRPGFSHAQVNLGRSLRAVDDHEQAIILFEAAVAGDPELAQAHDNLGIALEESGKIDEACLAFDRAIRLDPRQPAFYLNRLNARKLERDSPHRVRMEALAADMEALPEEDQIILHFALGKSLADGGDYEGGFNHLVRGNAMKRRQLVYNETAALARFERTKEIFTPELMQRLRGCGDPSRRPIFILGMPRSGSTLVEQILASHPKVFGGGERQDFRHAMRDMDVESRSLRFPDAMPHINPAKLRELGAAYLSRLGALESRVPGSETGAFERITDKMPANFRFAGLLHLALPNARIIHTSRAAVDTCLSCFSILFAGNQPFAYDLGELGRYYRGYAALMDHWRQVLPAGTMLDVQYESLIGNFEAEAARILAHCDLDWYEGCLSFHKTERPVRTASKSQVRQPLYGSAVGRWRLNGKTLHPLLDALGDRS